ncbi:MAG: hypothetical protein ACR2LE_08640 [Nocardioidaceae bacterium]
MTQRPRDRSQRPGEPRLPAAIAVLVAAALYAALPSSLIFGSRVVVPALELVFFIPVLAANPRRMTCDSRLLRMLSIALILLIAAANSASLVLLVQAMVSGSVTQGKALLLGAGQVWLTNIIVFALTFWELDRGGPVRRTQSSERGLPPADFRFPQDEDHDAITEVACRSSSATGWTPGFIDYFYVSVTNSSAFSPTDTMPLSPRAKLLMAIESVSALMLSVLAISRGVSLLK